MASNNKTLTQLYIENELSPCFDADVSPHSIGLQNEDSVDLVKCSNDSCDCEINTDISDKCELCEQFFCSNCLTRDGHQGSYCEHCNQECDRERKHVLQLEAYYNSRR